MTIRDGDILLDETDAPYWPERSFHIHTQHPLELTEVLQGHDIPQFGPHGSHCRLSSSLSPNTSRTSPLAYCERWEDMVGEVDLMFQWALANRLNKIEWLLLGNYKWGDELEVRMKRLQLLTALGHDYSLMVGADCPLGNTQQHSWYMVNTRLPFAQQVQQIRERVDWIFRAGFDFLTTESGLSEFTHPECSLMLALINEFAEYVNGSWGREAAIKVHCSTGQVCQDFRDEETGEPVNFNFNFLPSFASSKLGILPHTVQFYGLDDPTAGAYGNDNFGYMEDYIVREAKKGQRSVVMYGETAYWVNVDVDVPLFLPIYGQRRLHDLRRLAGREWREGFRIDGQMNFDSGWEWGYWLNDVITARASWDPLLAEPEAECDNLAHCAIGYSEEDDQWDALAAALRPLTGLFPESIGSRLRSLLVALSQAQQDLLIYGTRDASQRQRVNKHKKLSGIAYLSGTDSWVDLPRLFGLPFTQPDKVHFNERWDPDWLSAMELLRAMHKEFAAFSKQMKTLLADAVALSLSPRLLQYLEELDDCIEILCLRATHVYYIYRSRDDSAAPPPAAPTEPRPAAFSTSAAALLRSLRSTPFVSALLSLSSPAPHSTNDHRLLYQKKARGVIQRAAAVVGRREQRYRVPVSRVAAWRENPTVYRYGYLWSVHSLYYWWREQGRAEERSLQSEKSPCYLNRMDTSEVVVGWGRWTLETLRRLINKYSPFTSGFPLELVNCIAPQEKEYLFPRDLDPAAAE